MRRNISKAEKEAARLELVAQKEKYAAELAQFRAAEMVWYYPPDEDFDANVYFLAKEDGIKLLYGADPDKFVLVANPGRVRHELSIPASFLDPDTPGRWKITAQDYAVSPHAGEPDFDREYYGMDEDDTDDAQVEPEPEPSVTQVAPTPAPAPKPAHVQYDLFTGVPVTPEGILTPTS